MCGLFGIVQGPVLSPVDLDRADRARDVLEHRGPDHAGRWTKGGTYVGHRRLSIIDTSESGNQPMTDPVAVIAVNGEIYNFRSLRAELESHGREFRSRSDSEVVLHGYRQWGMTELAGRLDGMYAAVVYDREQSRLYALRDRAGIKPLYYYSDGHSVVWASELKAIVAYVGPDRLESDPTALVDFLACRQIPAPKTLYRNIHQLPPGHVMEFDVSAGALTVMPYWRLPVDEVDASEDILASGLVDRLRSSVHEQLVSDVPLGLLLSGGVDSSVVAALACERGPLVGFSIGFRDAGRDETPWASEVAAHTGANHHVHYLEDAEMVGFPERMAEWFDEPFSNDSAVPTYRVSAFAREQVTVALSGDGGDELFGGYTWYDSYARIRHLQRWWPLKAASGMRMLPLPRRRTFELMTIADPVALYARVRGSLPAYRLEQWRRRLGIGDDYDPYWAYRQHFHRGLPDRKAAQVLDFHTYLPNVMLTKVDRMSMAVSLECRPPFLSQQLIEFAFRLPQSFVYRGGRLKGGLKHAIRDLVPRSVLERDKQGFSVPDSGWRRRLVSEHGSIQEAIVSRFIEAS